MSAMDVVVCVKQIPDPADPGELDSETRTLKRDVKLILDEADSYGVEMALQLVDAAGEGALWLPLGSEPGGPSPGLLFATSSESLDRALAPPRPPPGASREKHDPARD